MGIIFDTNPKLIGEACLPEKIQCRKCYWIYGNWGSPKVVEKEVQDVR